jgi:hypothetical protein
MLTAWSAIFTKSALSSASEWTATVLIPISRQARITRTAISPRLATSSLRIGFGLVPRATYSITIRTWPGETTAPSWT